MSSKTNKNNISNKQNCLNCFNEFYYEQFLTLSNEAKYKNNKNFFLIYRKICSSIQKYPFPILTSSQAKNLEGVGENISLKFEKMIENYKEKIISEEIDYKNIIFNLNFNLNANKKYKSKKNLFNSKKEKNNLNKENIQKRKKNLINIKTFSKIWNLIISCYFLYVQNNNNLNINIDEILAISILLKENLKSFELEICIDENEEKNLLNEIKNLSLIDEIKAKKIKINDYLINFSELELKKLGLKIIKNEKNDEINIDNSNLNTNIFNNNNNNNNKIESEISKKYKSFLTNINNENSSNITLIIDQREIGSNKENFKNEILNIDPNIKIEERLLSLSDFLWVYKDPETKIEYIIDFLIERKTLNDLMKSIIDGRYSEQKYRMKKSYFKNLYYLFEGNLNEINNSFYNNINKNSIISAIYNTINIHDINIIKCNSTFDTIMNIINIDKNIKKNFSFVFDENKNKISYDDFIVFNNKNKNNTIEKIFMRQLRTFYNCGKNYVNIIIKCFKTPKKLFLLLKELKEKNVDKNKIVNIFNVINYLYENKKEINCENIIEIINNENDKNVKKGIKSVKKIRKEVVENLLKFYGFLDYFENEIIEEEN